jgi:two-component system OmpR family response regulator
MRLLILEDEPQLSRFLSTYFAKMGLVIDAAGTVADAMHLLKTVTFDIAVIDRSLPDGDGLSVVRAMRNAERRPAFLVLTARDSKSDVVEGLNDGADDYLVKPFEPDELIARVRAIARRGSDVRRLPISLGNLSLDVEGGCVTVDGMAVALRKGELLILQALMQRAGRVVTRTVLVDAVYGLDDLIESNTLEAQISRLRRKLRDAGCEAEITSLRGIGYIVRNTGAAAAGIPLPASR